MAEGIRFTSENNVETSDDEDDIKSKKKKSSIRLGSSAAAVVEKGADAHVATAERPKMNALDKLFAGLTLEKESKAKEKTKAEGAFAELGGAKLQPETSLSDEAEKAAVEKLEPVRELTTSEINGGEVVIDLHSAEVSADEGELAVAAPSEAPRAAAEVSDEPEEAEDPAQTKSTPPPTATGNTGNAGMGGSGRGGNNPPPPSRPVASPPPPPRPVASAPTPVYYNYNYNAAPPPPPSTNTLNQVLTQQRAAEQAANRARYRGRGEALVGGFIIGGLVEHLRHISREHKFEKLVKREHRKQNKRIEKVEFEQKLLKTEQLEEARKAEAERYKHKADAKYQLAETARMQMTQVEASKRAAEQQEHDKAELIERLNAQAAEQERLETEQLLKNSENRIETSAWHSIEVDKTGHAVQETDIAYGHEYYKERAHETGPKDVVTRDSVTGAAALTAATMQQSALQAQQSDQGLPPMLGMPTPSSDTASSGSYRPAGTSSKSEEDKPHASPASILVLLIALAIVAVLIIVLM